MHEGGIRVPAIITWPGKIKPGMESDHICAFQDVMPTFAEIAGKGNMNIYIGNIMILKLAARQFVWENGRAFLQIYEKATHEYNFIIWKMISGKSMM